MDCNAKRVFRIPDPNLGESVELLKYTKKCWEKFTLSYPQFSDRFCGYYITELTEQELLEHGIPSP